MKRLNQPLKRTAVIFSLFFMGILIGCSTARNSDPSAQNILNKSANLPIAPSPSSNQQIGALPIIGAQAGTSLPLSCSKVTGTTDIGTQESIIYWSCSGMLTSFDGTNLDTSFQVPYRDINAYPQRGFPFIVLFHGWGGSKNDFYNFYGHDLVVDLLAHGFAVLNYSARGFGKSYGQAHLDSKYYEVKDFQSIAGQIVDWIPDLINPEKVGVTGDSYGGGISWLIVTTSSQFYSPVNVDIKIAAAVPIVPWTDLLYSLMPNGYAGDGVGETDSSWQPIGIMKLSYVTALYAGGQRMDPTMPYMSIIPDLTEWYSRIILGEPYSEDDPVLQSAMVGLTQERSAYFQQPYFDAIRANPRLAVPVFDIQGWTDDLFPAPEIVRMYYKLLSYNPQYPIKVYLGDVGHPAADNKPGEISYVLNAAVQWFEYWLEGTGSKPIYGFTSSQTTPVHVPFNKDLLSSSNTFAGLSTTNVELSSDNAQTITYNPANLSGISTDPIVDAAAASYNIPLAELVGPITEPDHVPGDTAVYDFPVTAPAGIHIIGQPIINVYYSSIGTDVELIAKLWDVTPSGTQTLITRGLLRIASVGDVARIRTFGNDYVIPAGNTLELEISNVDFPYLRPDNLPSTTTIYYVDLSLPVK